MSRRVGKMTVVTMRGTSMVSSLKAALILTVLTLAGHKELHMQGGSTNTLKVDVAVVEVGSRTSTRHGTSCM